MTSIQALAEEALSGNEEAGQDLEQKIEEALACPCVDDLRNGPCGKEFVGSFSCYVRNFKAEDKLDDCYPKFAAMHECMGNNPAIFHKYGSGGAASSEPAEESK